MYLFLVKKIVDKLTLCEHTAKAVWEVLYELIFASKFHVSFSKFWSKFELTAIFSNEGVYLPTYQFQDINLNHLATQRSEI